MSNIIKKIYSGNKKSIIDNTLSLGIIKSFDLIIPLLVIPLLISRVGVNNYGLYAFAYSIIFYLLNITQYGFSLSAVRDIAIYREDQNKINKIFNEVFSTILFLLGLVLLLLFLATIAIPLLWKEYQLYLFFSLLIIGDSISPTWFFRGIEKMKYLTILSLVSKSTYLLFILLFIHSENDYPLIALCQSIGYLAAGLISYIYATTKYNIKFRFISFRGIILQLKKGAASFLTLIAPLLYANTSVFLTGLFGIPAYVTFIEVGVKISGAFNALDNILSQVFYPFTNRNNTKGKDVKKILLIIGAISSLLMFAFSEFLINTWLDGNNNEIILITKILSISPFIQSITSAYGINGLLVLKKDKLYMKIIIVSSFIGFLFALILIPIYYFIGAAITIILSRMLIGGISMFFYKRV